MSTNNLRFLALGAALGAAVAYAILSKKKRKDKSAIDPAQPKAVEFKIRPKSGHSMGVGVCCLVVNPTKHPGKVLLGRRQGSDGSGTFAPPGGHLEYGESLSACASREVLEETGLISESVHCASLINACRDSDKYHYVAPVMVCHTRGEPKNLEPTKCDGWEWYDWNGPSFPSKLFAPLVALRSTKFDPFSEPQDSIACETADTTA
mmetsp:Transcript_26212/g.58710  ORF Transcript_26212/g.58710 Transcript_26212/m.58710 type:complete len:206 (-) Transcript_26212:286-903(-)|eukprot:CAMPEP_0172587860 /NCGR_PEP_ID=MMETSP1068-20121228/6855_1 /TAXON_ID=35684 /ORGANISM="Pseudopedinella elastica, Strain CCMP716" /LENGTH=205 /DNA_ID=CAMNT_0013383021 /DNA_START=166 /DNA_END=783 /DNA_ORIENTATION=+